SKTPHFSAGDSKPSHNSTGDSKPLQFSTAETNHEEIHFEEVQQLSPEIVTRQQFYDDLPIFKKILLAFSVHSNLKRILVTNFNPRTKLDCLNGLRALSIFWVMLAHTYFFILGHTSKIKIIINIFLFLDIQVKFRFIFSEFF